MHKQQIYLTIFTLIALLATEVGFSREAAPGALIAACDALKKAGVPEAALKIKESELSVKK